MLTFIDEVGRPRWAPTVTNVRSCHTTAVAALTKDGWFHHPEDRDESSIDHRVQTSLVSPTTSPDVRGHLERLVEQAHKVYGPCCLLAPYCGHVTAQVAKELLWEFWHSVPTQHDISPQMAVDVDYLDDDATSARDEEFEPLRPELSSNYQNATRQTGVPWSVFSRAMWLAAKSAADVTRRSSENTAKSFKSEKTRDSSTKFESWWINKLLLPNHDEVVEEGNRELAAIVGYPFRLEVVSVKPDEGGTTTQGKQTTFTDLWVTLRATFERTKHVEILRAPVNLKHVSGGEGRNNSGGARMLSWAMLGGLSKATKNTVLSFEINSSMSNLTPLPDSDYLFLVFDKGDNQAPIGASWVSSLLNIDPAKGALYFNPSQSFPRIQIRYGQAGSTMTYLPTAAESRARLWQWMNSYRRRQVLEEHSVVGPGQVAPGLVIPPPGAPRYAIPEGYILAPEDQAAMDRTRL